MNVELLLKVKEAILAHPEEYNQSSFCGTAFCIAGWAVKIAHPEVFESVNKIDAENLVYEKARDLLNMGFFDFEEMTDPAGCWPPELREPYSRAETAVERAAAGAAAIDYYIERGSKQ